MMRNVIGWGGIVLMCALVGAGWGHAENQMDGIDDEVTDLYRWAKACEKRIIEGEKREAQLEKRVKRLEGRLYGP